MDKKIQGRVSYTFLVSLDTYKILLAVIQLIIFALIYILITTSTALTNNTKTYSINMKQYPNIHLLLSII